MSMNSKTKKSIKIVNVVVSSKLDNKINIEKLARMLPHSIYEPEVFSGLIYRRINPKSTIIMFASGKITSIGTKTEKLGRNAIFSTTMDINNNLNISLKTGFISTVNVVATCSSNHEINLKKFVSNNINVNYDPKKFSAAIITLKNGKSLLFKNGKIISVGTQSEKSAKSILEKVYKMVIQNKSTK